MISRSHNIGVFFAKNHELLAKNDSSLLRFQLINAYIFCRFLVTLLFTALLDCCYFVIVSVIVN